MADFAKAVLDSYPAEKRATAPSRNEIYGFVADTVELVLDEVKALRDRIAELEANGARFRGVYQRAADYRRGDQVTHRGSLWVALDAVPEGSLPGEHPTLWQLAAKGNQA